MKCPGCEKDISDDESVCSGCGLVPGPSVFAVEYAGFSARALALSCDVFVGCILALPPFLLVTTLTRESSWFWVLFVPIFVFYMTVAQFVFHTTAGKRLFGLEVRGAGARVYPDLMALFVRESAGRYLSGLWIAQGYLAATYDSLHMTWADRLAGTIVVKTLPVSRTMKVLRVLLIVGGVSA